MKNLKHLLFITISFLSLSAYAQTNKKTLNYQAVILDPKAIDIPGASITGQPLNKGNVCLRFSLLNAQGGLDYEETQQVTTDEYGLVSVAIGAGAQAQASNSTSIYKSFDSVFWNSSVKSLKVSVSYDGCSSFKQVSTQVFNYTPYALYAEAVDYKNVREAPTKLSQFANDAGFLIPKDLDPLKTDIQSNSSKIATANQNIADNKQASDAAFLVVNQSISSLDKQVAANTSSITTINTKLADQQNQITSNNNTMNAQIGGLQGQLNITNNTVSNLTGVAEMQSNKSTAINLGGANPSDQAYPSQRATKAYVDNAIYDAVGSGVPDATTLAAGKVKLSGDLGGTAMNPTVPALAGKENTANKSINVVNDGGSDTKYPSVKAVKDYVDQATMGTALQATVDGKADKNSPTFTGTPVLPTGTTGVTQASSDNSTKLATTAFVQAATAGIALQASVDAKADKESPALTGVPTAPTAAPNTNTTQIATTAYVTASLAAGAPEATTTSTGKVQLAGDLGGTATAPTVPGLALKANTSDVTSSLALKEDASNKSNAALGTSATLFPTQSAVKTYVDAQVAAATIADADATTKGKLKLAGDLGGSADAPTVPGLALKANATDVSNSLALKAPIESPTFTGTVGGITKSMVGLGNVNNTADADKPVSTAAQTALDLKEDVSRKSTATDLGAGSTSDVFYPSQKAVKTYVDAQIASGAPDATTSTTGKIQLAGDLGGNATAPTVPGLALKAPIESPTFTGTVGGISKSMVGLGNVDNTADADKPVSTAQLAALDLKAPLASPTFTGTPSLPTGTTAVTQSSGDNSTKLATTAFVTSSLSAGAPDATTSATGKIQLAGDLAGSGTIAAAPVISADAITTGKIINNAVTSDKIKDGEIVNADINASAAIADSKLATISTSGKVSNSATTATADNTASAIVARNGSGNFTAGTITANLTGNVTGNISGTAANVTGTVAVANGGTGATSLTGYIKGSGTTAMTASASIPVADVTGAAPIASPTFTGTVTSPIYASAPQNLTDGATISWNPTSGLNAGVTLGGNRTLSFSTAPASGSYGTLVITQDATGGRTLTLPSSTNRVLGSTSTTTVALSSAANARDILNFYFDGTTYFWNIGQGYGTAATITANNIAGGAAGSLPYQTGAGATGFLAKGSDGQILTLASGLPIWSAAPATGVTSVAMSTPTGLTVSGSPITSTGTLALSLATGYAIPTTTSQTNWDAAYTNRITSASSPLSISSNALSLGTVPIGSGGTGATTADAALTNLGAQAVANLSTDISTDAASTTKYPAVKSIKDYVDASLTSGAPDATTSATGKVQLAGDLAGSGSTAAAPVISADAITTGKIINNAVTSAKIAADAVTSAKILDGEIVNADISTTAAIADSKLATIATSGKVSNSATTATDANTASAIVARDANGNFTAGTITGNLTGNVTGNLTGNVTGNVTGNAATATKLAASKNINGVAFDGSTDITVTAAAGTLTGTSLNSNVVSSSLTSVGTLTNLTVTNAIAGSITGTAANVTGTVAVANGGTGAATLTGYVKGSGTSAMTASASIPVADVTGAAPLASPTFTGTVAGITKSMVGLGNVDNTADADKPVSTAQLAALDLKAPLASPTFTGTPSLPTGTTAVTQSSGDNSTKLATTAFVTSSLSAGAPDATTSATGKIQLAGDLAGSGSSATAPVISADAITTGKIINNAVTSDKIKDGEIVNADISTSAAIVDSKLATIATQGKVSNSATTATDANTASAIVARDGSGNFTAGTITGNLTGLASKATNINGGVIGAIPYQSSPNTTTLLTGNTAATKKFLTQTGDGSAAAAPVWEGVAVSDITGTLPVANGGTGVTTTATNLVFAGPTSGATPAAPSFRALVAADLPTGSTNYVNNGTTQQANTSFNISGAGTVGTTFDVTGNTTIGGTATITGATKISSLTASKGVFTDASKNLTSTGALGTDQGGTGLASFNDGGAMYASSTSALTTGTLPTSAGGTGLTSYTSGGALYTTSTTAITSGTLPISAGGTGATSANTNVVFAGPASGSAAAPSFRALVAADVPSGSSNYINNTTTQQTASFNISGSGTMATNLSVGGTAIITGATTLSALTASRPVFTDANKQLTSTGTLGVTNGGTGLTSAPSNGQILIGNGTGFTLANLTQGTGITITNASGSISIAAAVRPKTEQFTATASQTIFDLAETPLNGVVWMFINGVRTNNLGYSLGSKRITYAPASNGAYTLLAGDRIQFDYAY